MRTLSSTRQLAIPVERQDHSYNDAVVYGGIQYDYDSLAIANSINILSPEKLDYEAINFMAQNERSIGALGWPYLVWTQKEGTEIHELLVQNDYFSSQLGGYSATEESFKQIGRNTKSPKIIHVATHGFFFPDPKSSPKNKLLNAAELMIRVLPPVNL